jgi:predicted PurR-regulated permease PerM
MDIAWFTLVAIALYFGADRLLDWIERARGARFANRQVAFFAIMLPLALAAFWLVRVLTGPGP